jgi:hypothetical protein
MPRQEGERNDGQCPEVKVVYCHIKECEEPAVVEGSSYVTCKKVEKITAILPLSIVCNRHCLDPVISEPYQKATHFQRERIRNPYPCCTSE